MKYQIIYWRDIPAQVRARVGRQRISQPLSQRFQIAIDEAAMESGLTGSDAYLEEWRNGDWQEDDSAPEIMISSLIAGLESDYPRERLRKIVKAGGREIDPSAG